MVSPVLQGNKSNFPKGKYGEALGYRLTDGKFEVDTSQEGPIDCCGCGNWELIEEVDALQWNCLDANNNLTFGKYTGMNVEDIKNKDEDYFKWACPNVGGLSELLFVRKYDVSLQDLFKTKKQIKGALIFTSDDWIKSPVKNNYDFILDQYNTLAALSKRTLQLRLKRLKNITNKVKL